MNVFVLCTGRSGSTTFSRACSHIQNFSVGHESRGGSIDGRVDYPEDHIEVDNRLSWFLGRLDQEYGDEAFYVHLKRNKQATAESWTNPGFYEGAGIMRAYRTGILRPELRSSVKKDPDPIDVTRHYYDTVNANIALFLKDKPHWMEFNLETAKPDFGEFWDRIDATGNREAALSEWDRNYNASDAANAPGSSSFPVLAARKLGRILQKLPHFIKTA